YSRAELAFVRRTLPPLPLWDTCILFSDRALFGPRRGARLCEIRLDCCGLLFCPVRVPLFSFSVDFRPVRRSARFCCSAGALDVRTPVSPGGAVPDGVPC